MGVLRDMLRQAVIDRIDENTGVVVSGGIDSSSVCVTALQVAQELGYRQPYTFTGYYDVPGYDERAYARLVAGDNHKLVKITPEDIEAVFDEVARLAPEPIQGPGMIGQYIVARHVSMYVDAVLSGEGSDELFGGYARLMKVAGEKMPLGYEDYVPPADYPDTVEEALQYDYKRLPDLLAVDDAMCAAWAVRAEAPFTDSRIVEWALNLNPLDRVGKKMLKQEMQGVVPDAILNRRDKMGFPIPLQVWSKGPLRDFFMDRLGYLPEKPFDRSWWYELIESARVDV